MITSLAPYACHETVSRGRQFVEESPVPYRTEYQRDRDRILHCHAFRRLEYKTQVFINHEGDLFRTRLTHSLEVAQLGRTVARALRLNEDLVEAIALAHDLGHTPFGHAGQECLNQCMKNYGGFEHNLQALRIVEELEDTYPKFRGLNLMFETREGILKQCTPKQAKTLGAVAARFMKEGQMAQPTLEAQIVNLCDEIAYNNHDIDDGLRAKLISLRQLLSYELFEEHYAAVLKQWGDISQRKVVYETVRRMINAQISNVIETSRAHLDALQPKSVEDVRLKDEPMITVSALMYQKMLDLKQFLRTQLYAHYRVQRMSYKAHHIIKRLFEVFHANPSLLPLEAQIEVQRLQQQFGNDVGRARAVSDYISGMTDRFAIIEYERLFDPSSLLLV
jgi:dGTPase